MAAGPDAAAIAVAGATGLIGGALLRLLVARPGTGHVHALVRDGRARSGWPVRIAPFPVDYATLGTPPGAPLPPLGAAFCALGTTIKVAGSQAAFRAVDVDAVVAFARAARAAGATRFGLVSALGADARSAVFYNRCKGEAEDAVAALGFERLVIARPSLLLGDRAALGQPERPGERLAQRLTPWIGGLLPARWRPISAEAVARALVAATLDDPVAAGAPVVLESDALQARGAAATR